MNIDLNCDMGESFGNYHLGNDEAIMPYITSANIACGFHAGDPLVMQTTVRLAIQNEVGIGAHPGYPDLQGFGRRSMDLSPEEIENMVLYQIGALEGFVRAARSELVHVKPHGAMYNQAAKDRSLAAAVARAVAQFSKHLILVGLAGSLLVEMGIEAGLQVANEAFPDRAYNPDGSLRSRRLPGAVLETPGEVVKNALRLATEGIMITSGSQDQHLSVDTLCLHGDNVSAVENALQIHSSLSASGIELRGILAKH